MVKPNQKSAAQMQETWFADRDVLALVGTSLLESRCLRPNFIEKRRVGSADAGEVKA
jgi:hypothetical protein